MGWSVNDGKCDGQMVSDQRGPIMASDHPQCIGERHNRKQHNTPHHLGIREELKKNWPKMASGLVGHRVNVVEDWQQPLLGNFPVQEGQVGGETLREEGIKGKI